MSKPKKIFLDNINEFRVIEDGPISYIYFIVCNVHKNQDWRNSVKIGFSHNPQHSESLVVSSVKQNIPTIRIGHPYGQDRSMPKNTQKIVLHIAYKAVKWYWMIIQI